MAEVTVSTWAQLVEQLTTLGEDSTITLTADIDMNEQLPGGVTTTAKSKNYNIVIDGYYDGRKHSIKNLWSNSNIYVIQAYSYGKLTIKNVDFENVYMTRYGSSTSAPRFLYNVKIEDCSLSGTAVDCDICNGVEATRCGIKVTGSGTAAKFTGFGNKCHFCNIELNGSFNNCTFHLDNSYVSGDFAITTNTTTSFLFSSPYISVFNATVDTEAAPKVNGSATLMLINSDRLPEGITISSDFIACTTSELRSRQDLIDKSFPIG